MVKQIAICKDNGYKDIQNIEYLLNDYTLTFVYVYDIT